MAGEELRWQCRDSLKYCCYLQHGSHSSRSCSYHHPSSQDMDSPIYHFHLMPESTTLFKSRLDLMCYSNERVSLNCIFYKDMGNWSTYMLEANLGFIVDCWLMIISTSNWTPSEAALHLGWKGQFNAYLGSWSWTMSGSISFIWVLWQFQWKTYSFKGGGWLVCIYVWWKYVICKGLFINGNPFL